MNWYKSNAPTRLWSSIASDSTGNKLVAAANTGYIYTSNDAGVNWNGPYSFNAAWTGVASNSDGSRLYASVASDNSTTRIYTSINGGSTWTELVNCPQANWKGVETNSDGSLVVAYYYLMFAVYLPAYRLLISKDYGITWSIIKTITGVPGATNLALAVNADSTYIYAWFDDGSASQYEYSRYYIPSNIWQQKAVPFQTCQAFAVNKTSQVVYAAQYGGRIYTSTDYGTTFTELGNSPIKNWQCLATDSSGTNIIAGINSGGIWISKNSGTTWAEQTTAPTNLKWISVTTNSDGTQYSAAVNNGGIYYGIKTAPTKYYTIQTGQSTDLSDIFAPLSGTQGAKTNFIVENYNNGGVNKDLSEIFEPYTSGTTASTTNFIVENYNGTGLTKDLNLIFKSL